MKKNLLALAVTTALVMSAEASATTIEQLEAQMEQMKAQIAAMKAEQESRSNGFVGPDNIEWAGTAEFEIAEGGAGSAAKFELEATIQASEEVSGYAKLKAVDSNDDASAESGSDITLDEIAVTYDAGFAAITATTGGHPFGDFSTNMISDSVTYDIGDTGGSTKFLVEVPVGEMVTISGSADDDISALAATAEVGDLAVTVSHISDMATAGAVNANHISASYAVGDLSLYAEKVDSDGGDDASNVEVAYAFTVAGRDAGVAVGKQDRDSSASANSATVNLAEGLDLTVQHLDSDKESNEADAWTAQIAYGF